MTKRGIFTEEEFRARHDIHVAAYQKIVNIEALTSIDMALHQILPAALAYTKFLCDCRLSKKTLGVARSAEKDLVNKLSAATDNLYATTLLLKEHLSRIPADNVAAADYYRQVIISDMTALRREADILEQLTDKKYWPYPTYSDLLFY